MSTALRLGLNLEVRTMRESSLGVVLRGRPERESVVVLAKLISINDVVDCLLGNRELLTESSDKDSELAAVADSFTNSTG